MGGRGSGGGKRSGGGGGGGGTRYRSPGAVMGVSNLGDMYRTTTEITRVKRRR